MFAESKACYFSLTSIVLYIVKSNLYTSIWVLDPETSSG